jgi:glycosyltransferase involved in cell wall biosynthesis
LKILLISQSFPPNPGARALQIGKVKSAIESCGIDIRVIAGLNTPDKGVIRQEQVQQNVQFVPYSLMNIGQSFVARLFTRIYRELMVINPHNPWVRNTFKQSLTLVKDFQPDLIMTSSTPFESHMVGLKLKKTLGLPWVASFSDPWPSSINPAPYNAYEMPVFKFFQMSYLRSVLNNCNAVHMTNAHALKLMERKSGVNLSRKIFSIPHIGSKSNMNAAAAKIDPGWLIHLGFLSRERVSEQLLEAIQTAVISNPDRFKGLFLVGKVSTEFKAMVDKMGMNNMIRYFGSVSQEDAMAIAQKASALLVLEADMPESPFLPSKFADYARVGRPMIAVTPERSPIREYLTQYGGGYAVTHDQREISHAIEMVLKNETNHMIKNGTLSNQFSSRAVGQKYKQMFEKILINR